MAVLLTSPLHVVLQLDEFKPGVFSVLCVDKRSPDSFWSDFPIVCCLELKLSAIHTAGQSS